MTGAGWVARIQDRIAELQHDSSATYSGFGDRTSVIAALITVTLIMVAWVEASEDMYGVVSF